MAVYRLSRKAAADLAGIHEYSLSRFGLRQARHYLNGLHDRFHDLAQHPMLGRSADRIRKDLRRYEYRSHVVFYVPRDEDILVVRVLHEAMDVRRHLLEDEGEHR